MWLKVSGSVLRNRIWFLSLLAIITFFMGYKARFVELSYNFGNILPENDSAIIEYQNYINLFGEDGNVCVLGIQTDKLFELDFFNSWYDLNNKLEKISGVNQTFSVTQVLNLEKNESLKKFELNSIIKEKPTSQKELDSIKSKILSLPFYKNIIYNPTSNSYLMIISLDKSVVNSPKRIEVVSQIMDLGNSFSKLNEVKVHYSGLPLIRTLMSIKVQKEMKMFVILALIVTAVIMFYFFRSFGAVFFSMIVVIAGVIWSMGSLALLGYKITLLTALIPPLIIVIGIPNCIFLLNNYFTEFAKHGNKIKGLTRVFQKTGTAILMTNATTAVGFMTFAITKSQILKEFGIVASLNIMFVFTLSILIIPIVYSFLPSPKKKDTRHLNRKWINRILTLFQILIKKHRPKVYIATTLLILFSIVGVLKLKSTGNIIDDVSKNDNINTDLKFFEKEFKGIMPFEVIIDTKKKGGVFKTYNLSKMEELQDSIEAHPYFSRALSIVEVTKFSKQAYYNGNPLMYELPNNQEKAFIYSYAKNANADNKMLKSFIDSTNQIARISVQIADIGTEQMDKLITQITPAITTIFPPDKYNVSITGNSYIFLKGTKYLINNLLISVVLAITLISFFMALMFNSARMVLISLIPNLIPLLMTASLMGYFGIPLKPSTILIFSIAFGISVDDTIHFLSKYRLELKLNNMNISRSVIKSLRETGFSMMYTSIVLFFGFGIFIASDFGGTKALGLLISITLLFAMFSNLILLPSFLLSLEKRLITKSFNEPIIEIIDEEEDIEINALKLHKKSKNE